MPDITQRFTIDVSGAVAALAQLDKSMKEFGTALGSLGSDLKNFNDAAKKAFNLGSAGRNAESASNKAKRAFNALFTATNKVSQAGTKTSSNFNKVNTSFNSAASGASRLKGALSGITSAGNRAFQGLFGSLSQVSRILGTRILIQGFGALQRAIKDSVSAASELQIKIREVGTILPVTQRGADGLTESVRGLSDAFNLPINVVTEGLYQTVSNQIGDAATSLGFLETAAKFAKTAVTDIDTSVNLLSGVINAFGLTAGDTEAIADKLFKTIELGRTRASELAQSLGRVIPIASELGISLDEVLAGFATVTIAGIKTTEATTQLRGAFNSLLKPTTATKELLAELGFTSGEALIQARGLQGAFLALKEASGGSITELSKFVPRVRGMNAALILAGSGAERFQDNLRKIRDESKDILTERFEFVIESNAEQVANAVNRLKNLFTVDLGNAILTTLAKAARLVGGLDKIGAALKTLVPFAIAATAAIALLAAGLVAFVTVASIATGAATALGVPIAALAGIIALALAPLAAFAAISFSENNRIAAIKAEQEAIEKKNRQEIEFEKKQAAAVIAIRNARSRELNAVLQEEIAQFNLGFQKRVEAAKKANDEIIADQKRVVNAIVSSGEAIIKATQKRIKDEQAIQKDSASKEKDATQELSDFDFKARNKRFSQLKQFSNLQSRANQQRRAAVDLARKASGAEGSKEDIAAARAALDRAQSTAEEARSIAESLGNKKSVAQIERTIRSILQQKIRAEQQITAASKRRESIEKARLQRQNTELKNIKKLAKAVIDAPSLFDEDSGQALTGTAQAEAIKKRKDALTDFRKALLSSKELSIDQIIDFSQLGSNIDNVLAAADIKTLTVNSAAFVKLQADINSNIADFRAEFGAVLTTVEIAQDIKIENPAALSTALGQQIKIEQQTLQVDATAKTAVAEIDGAVKKLQLSLQQLSEDRNNPFVATLGAGISIMVDRLSGASGETQRFAKSLSGIGDSLAPIIQRLIETGTISEEQIKTIGELTKQFGQLGGPADAPLGLGAAATTIQEILDTLNAVTTKIAEARQLESQTTTQADGTSQLDRNAEAARAAEQAAGAEADSRRLSAQSADNTSQATQTTATNTQAASTATNTAVGATQAIAQAWTTAAAGAERVAAAAAASSGAATARSGRFFPRFLSGGGFSSRGTDTIPAMLSPGEFVINARSSKRFFSQLQAINAGHTPIFRQDGGPVTNVGDINVTVDANKEASSTGRQIARSIRRELRRGTSSL